MRSVVKFLGSAVLNLVLIAGAWVAVSALMHGQGPTWGEVAVMFAGLVLVGLSKVVGARLRARRRQA